LQSLNWALRIAHLNVVLERLLTFLKWILSVLNLIFLFHSFLQFFQLILMWLKCWRCLFQWNRKAWFLRLVSVKLLVTIILSRNVLLRNGLSQGNMRLGIVHLFFGNASHDWDMLEVGQSIIQISAIATHFLSKINYYNN
jgi:hypothetical protein